MFISIVYDSGCGHTAKQAEAVAEGVRKVTGTQAKLISVVTGQNPASAGGVGEALRDVLIGAATAVQS